VPQAEVLAELRRTSLFGGASDEQLRPLADRAYTRRLAAGQVLFTEGEPSEHLYVVRSGRIRIGVRSPHGDHLILSVLGPGDTFGELSVIDGGVRSATAEAVEAVELLALGAAEARQVLERHPALLMSVAEELAATVRRLTGSAGDLVFLDLPRRLAKLLLGEATRGADGRFRAPLGMSQSGVAARLGVTRQSLNRALVGLVRRGWVATEGADVVLLDPGALRRFTDS
jgi:CRP/FNR family transcriptional regulator, cyclic AMP receptor protein